MQGGLKHMLNPKVETKTNPFHPMFAIMPLESYIDRYEDTETILRQFTSGINGQVCIVTGVRGSGKTVFITKISNELNKDKDWIVIDLNAEMDLYANACSKLAKDKIMDEYTVSTKLELTIASVGFSFETKRRPFETLETALEDMLEIAKKNNKKVLFTVDEITNNDQTRKFFSSYQMFLRKNLPVFLLGCGLPSNVYDLQEVDTLTFLHRAPKLQLEPLNITTIRSRYKKLIGVSDEVAVKMAKLTSGYSFAYQLLGFLTWENDKKFDDSVLSDYDDKLAEFSYDKIYSELTKKDLLYVENICLNDITTTTALLESMHITGKEFSPYRNRLIKKGILTSEKRGEFQIVLPRFGQYIKNRNQYDY